MTAAKALVTVLVSAAGALVTALGVGSDQGISDLDWQHWLTAILAVLGSGGVVWFVQNGPWHEYIKAVVAFLSAGIASLVTALNPDPDTGVVHITQSEWLVAFIAAVTATGLVFQVANRPRVEAAPVRARRTPPPA